MRDAPSPAAGLARLAAVTLQLGLLLVVFQVFRLESRAFLA